jgi:hypothetical protein
MQNQSSPAQLLFPTVPNSFCPSGSWSTIFNSFIQLYLNNGTVNIPFLNEITPQQIQTINQNLLNIQNQLTAVSTQSGAISSISNGFHTYTVSFPTAMPNASYQIFIVFVNGGSATTTTTGWSLVSGTSSTTGFQFSTNTQTTDNISQIVWTVTNLTAL